MRYPVYKATHLPLVTLIVVLLLSLLPISIGQDKGAPPNQPVPIQVSPVTSAPTWQAVNPAQSSNVPQPTVVLKPGETPGITFKEPVYDFGRVRAGTDVTHDFEFTNTGTGPLEILLVKPACGCTTAGDYNRIIQPGQSGKLPLKLSTKGIGGRTSKPVTIHTNVPAPGATVTLTIQGDVWEPVAVEPKMATFGRLTAEAARDPGLVRKVTIANNTEQPANLTNVRSASLLFSVQPPTVVEPGKRFELTIGLASGLKPGNNSSTIELSTGVADAPTLSIPVSAYVLADVEATPNGIVLGPNRSALEQRQVSVQNNTKTPVKLSGLRVTNPALKVTLRETQPGTLYTLTVEIPADCVLPPEGERIAFNTDCPSVPEIMIPVREIRVPTTNPTPPAPVAKPLPQPAPAANPLGQPAPVATPPPPPAPGTKTPINDTDPVTRKPLTPTSPTLNYKGYVIGFCCADSAGYKGEWERMSENEKDAFVRRYLK